MWQVTLCAQKAEVCSEGLGEALACAELSPHPTQPALEDEMHPQAV